MAKSKEQKKLECATIVEYLKNMQSACLATVYKVKVKDEKKLRQELKKLGASYTIVKKTLLKRACVELSLAVDAIDRLTGTVALMVGRIDAVTPLKALVKFAKGRESFIIEGGFLAAHGTVRVLTRAETIALSELPSRDELRARVVGSLASPLSGMVNVLVGNCRGLVQVLSAYQKSKSG